MRVVDIERGEPAVRALHADEPVQRPGQRFPVALGLARPVHGPGDHRRVVEVRIVTIGELKGPTAARQTRALDLPVAGLIEQLLLLQPVERRLAAVSADAPPASCIARAASAVSQTGDTHGWQ